MLAILFARLIAKYLQGLAGANVRPARSGKTAIERVDRRVLVDEREARCARRPDRVRDLSTGIGIDHDAGSKRRSRNLNQISTFGRGEQAGEGPYIRTVGQDFHCEFTRRRTVRAVLHRLDQLQLGLCLRIGDRRLAQQCNHARPVGWTAYTPGNESTCDFRRISIPEFSRSFKKRSRCSQIAANDLTGQVLKCEFAGGQRIAVAFSLFQHRGRPLQVSISQ